MNFKINGNSAASSVTVFTTYTECPEINERLFNMVRQLQELHCDKKGCRNLVYHNPMQLQGYLCNFTVSG